MRTYGSMRGVSISHEPESWKRLTPTLRVLSHYVNKYQARRIGQLWSVLLFLESDSYFLTVLRYIHQNPIKANIVKNIWEYTWTSYNDYISINKSTMIDTDFALCSNSRPCVPRWVNSQPWNCRLCENRFMFRYMVSGEKEELILQG